MKQLGVFAKFWAPGAVKTRLATTIGDLAASRLYRQFLETTLHRCASIADRRWLVYWPANRSGEFRELGGVDWELRAQRGDDLGERMADYFAAASSAETSRNVLIGSDSPHLPTQFLDQAFALLDEYPVVLGPTDDGGYYLLGIRGQAPDLFRGVAWGTNTVYQQTVAALLAQQIPFAELPGSYDVDDFNDLLRLADELSAEAVPGLERLRAAVLKAAKR